MRSRGRGLALAVLLAFCLWLQRHLGPLAFSNGARRARAQAAEVERRVTVTREKGLETVDVAVACMLCGSISFVMGLFYLVSHHDHDIRRYSWEVISGTIAIFTSVLLFQGLDGIFVTFLVQHVIPAGSQERQLIIILVSILHFMAWFTALHAVVAKLAYGKSTSRGEEDEEAVEQREMAIKCWSTLLSHMTAFAAIAAVCDMQLLPMFAGSPLASAVPVAMHTLVLFALFRLTDYVRNRLLSSSEGGLRERINMWDAEGEEGENDLAAISLSFLLVQVLRYAVSGVLGDQKEAPLPSIFMLLALSLLFLGLLFVFVRLLLRTRSRSRAARCENDEVVMFHPREGFDSMRLYMRRWGYILLDTSGMSFAWCLLYATKWAVHRASQHLRLPLVELETVSGICLALCTSAMAFLMIFAVDWTRERRHSHDLTSKQLSSIIRSLGILIGFAWEQSFDAGVEAMAKLTEPLGLWHSHLTKFLLACVVGLVVVPAWRHHILKTVLTLRNQRS